MRPTIPLVLLLALVAPLAAQEGKKKGDRTPAEVDKALARALEQKKVTASFDEAPISQVTGFIQDLTAIPIVLGPGIDPAAPVTFKVNGLAATNALKLALGELDGDHELRVWNGVVFLSAKGHELPALPSPPESADSPLAQTMTLNFGGLPFAHFKGFLVDNTGLEVVIDEEAEARLARVKVALRISDLPLWRLLPLLQALYGVEGKVDGQALRFSVPAGKQKE